jgi:hypothetical protein
VDHYVEKERGFLQFKKGLEKNKMTGAAHGQKFRQPLNNAKNDRLNDSDFGAPSSLHSILDGGGCFLNPSLIALRRRLAPRARGRLPS